jgi:hypothetical protein
VTDQFSISYKTEGTTDYTGAYKSYLGLLTGHGKTEDSGLSDSKHPPKFGFLLSSLCMLQIKLQSLQIESGSMVFYMFKNKWTLKWVFAELLTTFAKPVPQELISTAICFNILHSELDLFC